MCGYIQIVIMVTCGEANVPLKLHLIVYYIVRYSLGSIDCNVSKTVATK